MLKGGGSYKGIYTMINHEYGLQEKKNKKLKQTTETGIVSYILHIL